MKLINQYSEKSFPMEKVGPYTTPRGELLIEKKEQSIEWCCEMEIPAAVLLGAPAVEVLEASRGGRRLLEECLLSILIDGEPALKQVPLLGPYLRIKAIQKNCFFVGSENDELKGIFIVNGTWLKAVVTAPRTIEDMPKIRISVEAELYRMIEGTA